MFIYLACLFLKKILLKCLSQYRSFGGIDNILAAMRTRKNLERMFLAIYGLQILLAFLWNLFFLIMDLICWYYDI